MNLEQAKEVLSKHTPLTTGYHNDELIIVDKRGWPFCLETQKEMHALIILVNESCSCLPNSKVDRAGSINSAQSPKPQEPGSASNALLDGLNVGEKP